MNTNAIIIAILIILISAICLAMTLKPLKHEDLDNRDKTGLKKEDSPVVSQTGKVKPSYRQILENHDLIPGNRSEVWSAEHLHRYCTATIEEQPYGFPASAGALLDWKGRESDWQKEYSHEAIKTDISKVKFNSNDAEYKQVKLKRLINLNYYHNPEGYCFDNPNEFPCPNYWIKDKTPSLTVSGNMSFAGFPERKKHVKFNIPPEGVKTRDDTSYRGYV